MSRLKYPTTRINKHAIPDKAKDENRSAQFWGQFLNHLGLGVALRVLSKHRDFGDTHLDGVATGNCSFFVSRNFGRAIPFFIERWEKEHNKPHFYVVHPMEPTGIVEVQVRVNNRIDKRRARFYIISIGNDGIDTAEKVTPIVEISLWQRGDVIAMTAPAERPNLRIDWPRDPEEFEGDTHAFATALVFDALKRRGEVGDLSLYGGGAGFTFTLFFTIEGDDAIYFQTATYRAVRIQGETSFGISLFIQAKDMMITPVMTFKVKARAWNDFDVKEGALVPALNPPFPKNRKAS